MIPNLPNLIIPGFPKSGTSSLFNYLSQHPDIFHSKVKEPHTYAFDERYCARMNNDCKFNFDEIYKNSDNFKFIPDASTIYMISKKAIKRIKNERAQNLKFIIVARDPIERIFSHYNWLRMLDYKQEKFKYEIKKENSKFFSPESHIRGNYKNYIQFSKYGEQIKNLYNLINKDQVLIVSAESLKNSFDQTMHNIFKFLELKPIKVDKTPSNVTPSIISIRKKTPTKIRRLEKKLNSQLISDSFLFTKNIKPKVFNTMDEKLVFGLLEDDLKILSSLDLIFPEWKTVNKYL